MSSGEPCLGDGISVLTNCRLLNHAGQYVRLDSQNFWHGYGDPPKVIQDEHPGKFEHTADAKGSIGGIAYILGTQIKWIIAWSNAEDEPNKVYTEILEGNKAIDWAQVKASLGKSGTQSSDKKKFGYSSEAEIIDETSPTPRVEATLRPVA